MMDRDSSGESCIPALPGACTERVPDIRHRPHQNGPMAGLATADREGALLAGAQPGSGQRDAFLDVVRAAAILRVLVWHLFGFAFISYLVAAMPAVFFVSGSLFASSAHRAGGSLGVLADRLRRLFIPLWVFCAVIWIGAACLAYEAGAALPWSRALTWFLPVVDAGQLGEGLDFISSPLWFVRALLWLLLLAPVLLRVANRRPSWLLMGLAIGVFAVDAAARQPGWTPASTPRLWWYLGDLCLYGTFFVAGFLHERGLFVQLRARHWLLLTANLAVTAAWWRLTQAVPDGVVDNSQPLHLLVGAAWLALAFAAATAVERVPERRPIGVFVAFLSRRSLTIYLWHTTVMVLVIEMLERRGSSRPLLNDLAYVALTTAGVLVVIMMFGWVEDLAAGRRPRLWPVPVQSRREWSRPLALVAVGALATLVIVEPWAPPYSLDRAAAAAPVRVPRVPSQAPPPPVFEAPEPEVAEAAAPAAGPEALPATLEETVEEWAVRNEISGVIAGVRAPSIDRDWVYARGSWPGTDAPMTGDDQFDIASMTKLFTSALVFRAADVGLLQLDEPLPTLEAVPEFAHQHITPRMLLGHRSGLVNYRETPEFKADPGSIDSAEAAIEASMRQPLEFEPGSASQYSSVNFLVLGVLLEQVWGRSYSEVLADELLVPLGLTNTFHLPSGPAEPRHGAAGIVSTVPDLMRATQGMLRDSAIVPPSGHEAMRHVDPQTGLGVGVVAFCPCVNAQEPTYFSHGYFGMTAITAFVPTLDVIVTVTLPESIHGGPSYGAVIDLMERLARLVDSTWEAGAPAGAHPTPELVG